uniref:Uncharacterized protein n=1 Tax=Pipistrellus kuhlii TaxID=59472 RepID=A0A7J7VV76_PIPKU|nr:hypothetical protein mPipKuh1_008317 [Pipistrellus kuhlii]
MQGGGLRCEGRFCRGQCGKCLEIAEDRPCPFHTKPGLSYNTSQIASPGARPSGTPGSPPHATVFPPGVRSGTAPWGPQRLSAPLSSGREVNPPDGCAQGDQHDLGFGVRRPRTATPSQGWQARGYAAQVCVLHSKVGSSQDGLQAVTGGRQEPETAGLVGRCWVGVRGARLRCPAKGWRILCPKKWVQHKTRSRWGEGGGGPGQAVRPTLAP